MFKGLFRKKKSRTSRRKKKQVKKTNSLKRRRSIVDRNNRLIAYDKPLYKLWAHPQYFKFPGDNQNTNRSIEEVSKKISLALNKDYSQILEKFINILDVNWCLSELIE